MITLKEGSRIYVACPAAFATGGPELLHQLAHKLNGLGFDAAMYYLPKDHPSPVHEEYRQYKVPFVREVEDCKSNVLILPEVATLEGRRYRKVRRVIWWLSVDNLYVYHDVWLKSGNALKRLVRRVILKRSITGKGVSHLVQSEYAWRHLAGMGVADVHYLSDYLNGAFINRQQDLSMAKEDIVVYNPRKGFEYTSEIIKAAPDIRFVQIKDMTRAQVADLLQRAKVYIDFGNHPGKDRIPREAAISGCCVITGRRGAAGYHEDLPIPEKYKIEDIDENIPLVISRIRECLSEFGSHSRNFDGYRRSILKEEEEFDQDLKSVFCFADV